MVVIMYLAIFMVLVGTFFLVLFLFAMKNGQFEDMKTPAHKILLDDEVSSVSKDTSPSLFSKKEKCNLSQKD